MNVSNAVRRVALLAIAAGFAAPLAAETLYAVSVRTYSDPSYKGVEGNLYSVNPQTAAATLIAPVRLDGRDSIGLDGLAIHPKTREFFGITAPTSTLIPHSLVHLDPETGNARLIGDLGVAGSDLSFDPEGTLFIWLPETAQLGKVNLKTGAVAAIGAARPGVAAKGGLDIVSRSAAFIASSGANGTLDNINLQTGVVTRGVKLQGARFPDLINGLASTAKGALYAVNTNGGAPALADLVRIDVKSGQIATLGPLPNDTDALTFDPAGDDEGKWDLERWRSVLLVVLAVFAVGLLITVVRTHRP
jgi:hypothetical protein